jgi:hypothetical protein
MTFQKLKGKIRHFYLALKLNEKKGPVPSAPEDVCRPLLI